MDNFSDEDIDIFLVSYKKHVLENPLLNQKIPVWVEFLKTKKYYRENGMEEDYFFKKRFGITTDDLVKIHALIERVKSGKSLDKRVKSTVKGNAGLDSLTGFSSLSTFDENEDYASTNGKFELMNDLQGAMDSYHNKMKKSAARRNWKQQKGAERNWHPEGTISGVPDRYYEEDLFSERPQISYDVQAFARTGLLNMSKTNQIQKLEKIDNILNDNDLIVNDYSDEYKRSVPNMDCRKKVQFTNELDSSIGVDQQMKNMDIGAARFWQDQDILNAGNNTNNNKCVPNKNPFEHHFQYLDANYNRVPDPRLMGQSARSDNKSMFKR
jgi:hypothetical protein